MKSFAWRALICFVPILLGAIVVGRAFHQYQEHRGGFKLGVDLVGGTILVYEADPEKTPKDFNVAELAEKIKKRIDPADLYNITVRPVPPARVEIVMPTGGSRSGGEGQSLTSEDVERAKELISRVGSLRFLILANTTDDREAVDIAQQMYGPKMSPELKAQLEYANERGLPPVPPRPTSGVDEGFEVHGARHTYTWIELGRKMRHDKRYNLYNDAENETRPVVYEDNKTGPPTNRLWQLMAEARKTNSVLLNPDDGLLYYSREVPKEREARIAQSQKEELGPKRYEYFVLARNPESPDKDVTGRFLVRANVDTGGKSGIAVSFGFDNEGGSRFYELTSKNRPSPGGFKRHLAIILDEMVESAPTINEAIRNEGQISGNFTMKEANQLVSILRAGALPATLKPLPVAENTIGATLGAETIKWGSISVALAFAAVLAFMLLYYRFAGLVACIALLANLLLTVAVMVLVNATFTLPGLAGLVLTLGMAVDANVLIYERLREERERGASLALAIRNAYDRSFATIIDTHLSSIFTAVVLYIVGNDQLKGFGISLTLGLIISLFTSLYMTRLMFDFGLAKGVITKLSMFSGLTNWLHRHYIDFMGIRKPFFTATVILTILGAALFLYRGKSGLNIDFTGGTLYSGQLTQAATLEQLREALEKDQESRLNVQSVTEVAGSNGKVFHVKYEGEEEARRVNLADPTSPEEVRRRLSHLPDFALELTYGGAETTGGSRYFTLRTSERSPEIVQTAVNRLLDARTSGVRLQRIRMNVSDPKISPETRKQVVTLTFTNAETREEAYASESQVRRLLQSEFSSPQSPKALQDQAEIFVLTGDEEAKREGRYSRMTLTLTPVPTEELKAALKRTADEFLARPQPERLEVFDSALAEETQTRALYAILASWGAILLYLWFRFGNWTFGLAAVLCLVHDLFFTLGAIAASHYIHQYATPLATVLGLQDFKIDLPAVAALLTLVGYSVNDTIVVFDRIREVRGKNPELTPKMINDSVNQTLSRTLLASLTVWLVVIVLYIFGGEGVHLFAFVMVVGVIVGTYSSIYIASPLLLMFGEGTQPTTAGQRPAEATR